MINNTKQFYFMAGLPRSGSTMLSAILNQNPKIYSGPSSPILGLMMGIETHLAQDELFLAFPKPDQGKEIVQSLLSTYYSDVTKPIVIDKNRAWINQLPFYMNVPTPGQYPGLFGYFEKPPKILVPVRDVAEILTSFITMCRRNPYNGQTKINFVDEMLIKSNIPLTDDNRCSVLAGPNGILGQSMAGLREVYMKGMEKYIHLIEYNDLLNDPDKTMMEIYNFLEEEPFSHDFNNLKNIHQERDQEVYGLSDMHAVRGNLHKSSLPPEQVLSPEILMQCNGAEFWRNIASNEQSSSANEFDSIKSKLDMTETKHPGVIEN